MGKSNTQRPNNQNKGNKQPNSKDKQKSVKKVDFKSKSKNKEQKPKFNPFDKKKAEIAAFKEAKEARIKVQKQKKLERNKIISKRTKRGQPVMKDRIEFLLKKIEASRQ